MWRQGDILIEAITTLPTDATQRDDLVLAEERGTGHRHKVEAVEGVKLFERGATLYLDVRGPRATITHPEHASIVLRQGRYRIWLQREHAGEPPNRPVAFFYYAYPFWILGSRVFPEACIRLANAGDGPWVRELHPVSLPPLPIQFWYTSVRVFGPVLDGGSRLVLFRQDLVLALRTKTGLGGRASSRAVSPAVFGVISALRAPTTTLSAMKTAIRAGGKTRTSPSSTGHTRLMAIR